MSTSTYHHGDLRRQLLTAGEALLVEQGLSSLSLREVARRLGVSHNAPYRHFPTRDALLAALVEQGYEDLAQRAKEAVSGAASGEAMIARGLAYVQFALDRPAIFRLMFSGEVDETAFPQLRAKSLASLMASTEAIADAFGEEQLHEAVISAWALVHGLAQLLLDGQVPEAMRSGRSDRQLAEAVLRSMAFALGRH
jgi:AcrR family transcriptional regulator